MSARHGLRLVARDLIRVRIARASNPSAGDPRRRLDAPGGYEAANAVAPGQSLAMRGALRW